MNSEESKEDENELADDHIPTYEEYLQSLVKDFRAQPHLQIAKAAVEAVKYVLTRETLMISMLLQKDVLQEDEISKFFGDEAHSAAEIHGIKHLTKYLIRAASKGEIISPDGKAMDPDTVLVILNDILDLNNTGWDGRTIELVAELRGETEALRKQYESTVNVLEKLNAVKKSFRDGLKKAEELKVQQRTEREHKLRIYLSRCRIADSPEPSEKEQQEMIDGTRPIPEQL